MCWLQYGALVVFAFLCRTCVSNNLMCSIENKRGHGIVPKQFVSLNCSLIGRFANLSEVDWYRVSSSEGPMDIISSEQGVAIWRLHEDDNGVEFVCKGRHIDSNCSIIPLQIGVNVSIESSTFSTGYTVGMEASFICKAEGIPHIAGYNWYKDGLKQTLSNVSHNNKIITFKQLRLSDNSSVITCEAYVPSGLRANASIVIDLVDGGENTDISTSGLKIVNLWILIACAAAGGIPVFVFMVVCLAWCCNKSRARNPRSTKKRSQSRRHIVLNEEQHESQPAGAVSETALSESMDNGLNRGRIREDDGTNPPCFKPAPPPPPDSDSINAVYINTPTATVSTLPNNSSRPTSPHYLAPRPTHQRKKTEYENVAYNDGIIINVGESSRENDLYENVAPNLVTPRLITLSHTSSLPNCVQYNN
ncbi:uncharacterized protein [Asterias amurensis]|uniref:uncharacterized protein n=1 Tax=Asterias amurensis TaxID=7602 RepID=UPI003AB4E5DD